MRNTKRNKQGEKPAKVSLKFKGLEKEMLDSVALSLNVSRANLVRAATLMFLGEVREEGGTPIGFLR